MSSDLERYVMNPGPKAAVTGLKAAVTTDASIATEIMVNVLEFHNALREIVDWFERYLRNNHDSL